jgi:hypothetical protein
VLERKLAPYATGEPRGVDIHETRGLPASEPLVVPSMSATVYAIQIDADGVWKT